MCGKTGTSLVVRLRFVSAYSRLSSQHSAIDKRPRSSSLFPLSLSAPTRSVRLMDCCGARVYGYLPNLPTRDIRVPKGPNSITIATIVSHIGKRGDFPDHRSDRVCTEEMKKAFSVRPDSIVLRKQDRSLEMIRMCVRMPNHTTCRPLMLHVRFDCFGAFLCSATSSPPVCIDVHAERDRILFHTASAGSFLHTHIETYEYVHSKISKVPQTALRTTVHTSN